MPTIHLAPFSHPRKKLCIPPHSGFPLDTHQLPTPPFSSTLHGVTGIPLCCLTQDCTPAGIQGARHAQYSISLSDLRLNKLQAGLFHAGFHHRLDHPTISPPRKFTTSLFVGTPPIDDDISCLLSIGSPSTNRSYNEKKPCPLVLFGQSIFTEQQISLSNSGNSSSDGNNEKRANLSSSDGSASRSLHQNGENSPWFRDHRAIDLDLETGHCKVFVESEDVGRSLDLSVFGSYEELYGRLADMFGIEKSEIMSHVLYRDAASAVKHTGDAPFIEFMKTARKLTILMD